MPTALNILKKILGPNLTKSIRPLGHGIKSWLAAAYFGFPARKLKLIGINGTKGKTSTAILTGRLLNLSGIKVGYISTAIINDSGMLEDEHLNTHKMTTIDGISLQKHLSQMVKNGCQYAVLEMSSQGLEQNRHWGLGRFFITTFLNLYPEHLEAHGGLENYKKAKSKLFSKLEKNGFFVFNSDSAQLEHSQFMESAAKKSIGNNFTKKGLSSESDYKIITSANGFTKSLQIKDYIYTTNFLADFEISNFVYSWQILNILKPVESSFLEKILNEIDVNLPGRMEFVLKNGNSSKIKTEISPKLKHLSVIVDYAHEPESMKQLLNTFKIWKEKQIYTQVIHILSSDGAGRDDWKKAVMGKLSFDIASYSFITTDNYDAQDNPQDILNQLTLDIPKDAICNISNGVKFKPETLESKKVISCVNRKKAMQASLDLANYILDKNPNEKILICSVGVGAEQGLTQPGEIISWDERKVWRELIGEF